MNKKSKIIVASLVAVMGVGASVGTAFAAYQMTKPQEVGFQIGTYSYQPSTGDLVYKCGAPVTNFDEGKTAINPSSKHMWIKVPLGGLYPTEGSMPRQDYVYGNLSVKATIDDALKGKVRWAVYMQGYNQGTYWANTGEINTLTRKGDDGKDALLSDATTTVSGDVAVTAVENPVVCTPVKDEDEKDTYANQWVEIYLDFEGLTDANFWELAEKTFRVDVSWDNVSSNVVAPFIVGDGNTWVRADEYRMVPNIKSDKWEWAFKGITGFSKMKLVVPNAGPKDDKDQPTDRWIGSRQEGHTDEDGNLTLTAADTYSVYWSGSDKANHIQVGGTDQHTIFDDLDA